jgi:hypothetical protein
MVIWVALLIVVLFSAVYLSATALPRVFLSLRYMVDESNDRCIKRVYEKNGESMVFEPEEKWRRYIRQYVLAERNNKKELMCKVDKNLSYIDFDIAVFNNQDELECVIKVKDYVDKSGYTKVVELPEETSYVSINVLRVENQAFEDKLSAKVTGKKLAKFLAISMMMIIMESLLVKICFANIYGGVFRERFVINLDSLLVTLAVALGFAIINAVTAIIAVKSRERKFAVKVKKDAK